MFVLLSHYLPADDRDRGFSINLLLFLILKIVAE